MYHFKDISYEESFITVTRFDYKMYHILHDNSKMFYYGYFMFFVDDEHTETGSIIRASTLRRGRILLVEMLMPRIARQRIVCLLSTI